MSVFSYLALSSRGVESRGQIEAPDEVMARRQLRAQGMRVMELRPGPLAGSRLLAIWHAVRLGFARLRPVSGGDRVLFFRQMFLMQQAGHTLLEALSASAKLAEKARLADALTRIAARIQQGNSFSAACHGEKELFNRLALRLLEAGEASGELGAIFDRLANLIERRAEVKRQLVTAMVYPGIVLMFAIAVISFLVISVIPRFATYLNGRGKGVPWAAQLMLDISAWLGVWGGWIVLGLVAFGLGMTLARMLPTTRSHVDRLMLALPVIGSTLSIAAMSQLTWVLGLLIRSRLTVLDALRACREVSSNAVYAAAFAYCAEEVLVGRTLATAFEQTALPRLVCHMAAVGEKSGQIDVVMESLGAHYQKALEARVRLLAAMIEPALTLLIGVVVGFVYYVFFKTMLTVSTGG
jgi:type IV pilus assembly protein PilC